MDKTLAKSESRLTAPKRSNRLFPSIFDSWFEPFFGTPTDKLTGRWGGLDSNYWNKTDNGYKLEVNLPKYKREDVSINVEGSMLFVEGKKENAPFFMEISIPSYADAESVKAKLEDGVLTVSANQLESAKSKKIEIE